MARVYVTLPLLLNCFTESVGYNNRYQRLSYCPCSTPEKFT